MTAALRNAFRTLAICAVLAFAGVSPAAALPILRGLDTGHGATDSESWVEQVLGEDVFMIAVIGSEDGALTGLGEWEFVSLSPGPNPLAGGPWDSGSWSYSGSQQVAYYSVETWVSASVWEPDTPNQGPFSGLRVDHITLWGSNDVFAGQGTGSGSTPTPGVPEPTASVLFAVGLVAVQRTVRHREALGSFKQRAR